MKTTNHRIGVALLALVGTLALGGRRVQRRQRGRALQSGPQPRRVRLGPHVHAARGLPRELLLPDVGHEPQPVLPDGLQRRAGVHLRGRWGRCCWELEEGGEPPEAARTTVRRRPCSSGPASCFPYSGHGVPQSRPCVRDRRHVSLHHADARGRPGRARFFARTAPSPASRTHRGNASGPNAPAAFAPRSPTWLRRISPVSARGRYEPGLRRAQRGPVLGPPSDGVLGARDGSRPRCCEGRGTASVQMELPERRLVPGELRCGPAAVRRPLVYADLPAVLHRFRAVGDSSQGSA